MASQGEGELPAAGVPAYQAKMSLWWLLCPFDEETQVCCSDVYSNAQTE